MTKYHVIEQGTENVMGIYSTIKRAHRKADKLDLEYGCIHYYVKAEPLADYLARERNLK